MHIRYTGPGFYKYIDGKVVYAKTAIYGKNYHLDYWDQGAYEYPVDGWYWFDSGEEALAFFAEKFSLEAGA